MATIQSLGIGSGLLTSELLEQLIEAERAPQLARLDSQQEFVEAKLSAFGEISSALSDFNSSVKALGNTSAFNASQVSSSNEQALTATAASTASAGNYSVNIQSLAQQHSVVSGSFASVNEAVGSGTLNFRFGTTDVDVDGIYQGFTANEDRPSRSVVINSSNNSLAGIRDTINAANIGVQATIVDDGSGFRLLLSSQNPGAANSLEITATGIGLQDFNFNAQDQGLTQTQAAQDAVFSVNGLSITRESNLVTGVIPGVTLNLRSTTSGPVSLGISKDPEPLMDRVQTMVDSYNALRTLSKELSKFDPDAGDRGQASLLTGDTGLRRIMNEVNSTLRSFISGNAYSSLAEVGVRTDQNNDYQLTFDRSAFTKAFADNAQAVTALFAATGKTSDSSIQYLGTSNATQPGSYAVEITRLATVGTYNGVSVAALADGNITIDASNKAFTILINGLEADISLQEGVYASAEDLALELQRKINSNVDVLASEHSASATYNSAESRFELSSNRHGSESVIRFTDISAAASSTLGLVLDGRGPFQGNRLAGLATSDGQSSTAFNTPLVVDSATEFSLSINGVNTGVLTLPGDADTPVTYNTPDELTAALQSQINTALAGEGLQVNVSYQYDADNDYGRLVIATDNAGDSLVMGNVNFAAANRLGFFIGSGAETYSVRGVDVAGRIDGVEAIGAGQILTAASGQVAARPGFYLNGPAGNLSASTPADRFRVEVDGILSGDISLGVIANTNPVAVAQSLQTAINNNPALLGAGVSVKVEYDTNTGGFGIISNSFGASSSVQIASVSGNAGSIFGFGIGRGVFGEQGRSASGEANPAAGLRLQIEGGSLGDRGTVTYTRGVANRMSSLIDSFLAPGGVLTGRQDALNTELENIADKRVALDERIARSERRLASSFLANDLIISNFNSTADFLTSQLTMLEALATPQRKNK